MRQTILRYVVVGFTGTCTVPAVAATLYANLTPDSTMAAATRQESPGAFEIETGDDFAIATPAHVTAATFVGLVVPGVSGATAISQVSAEIYRVFPRDSDTTRTPAVATRTNSPSDVAFATRDSAAGELSFSSTLLNPAFTASNSVQPGGIHAAPNQTTGGNGPVSGAQITITASFATPFDLPADHYFFVPQVTLSDGASFFWLSASRPISGSGTTPFAPDLQAWTRDGLLDPDWSRIGTDIVGGSPAPTFNMAFSLEGTPVPLPASAALLCAGLVLVAGALSPPGLRRSAVS
jgi:hypothetical protein